MRATDKKKTVIAATAITTILSATAALAVMKTAKKTTLSNDLNIENDFGFSDILDGLVKDGTITQIQEDAIQDAIQTVNEAATAGALTREENEEFTTVPSSSKTAFIRLKKSLSKMGSHRLKKPSQQMEILREARTVDL